MDADQFKADVTYDDVYVLFLDASGYSSIVQRNPRDRAAHAFDLLRVRLIARIEKVARDLGCARAELWSWRGDGGFFILHDDNESVTRDVTLSAGRAILTEDVPQLREELAKAEFAGELRLRLAVHKGPIRLPADRLASIHSPHINFAAHLEEAVPPDRLAISDAVHRVAGPFTGEFEWVGVFEEQQVHLMQTPGEREAGRRTWLRSTGLPGGVRIHGYPRRPSQQDKAHLVSTASEHLLDLGTTLNSCSNRLVTTDRPAVYRDAVLDFLRRGGRYRCVLLDPAGEATVIFSRLRGEQLAPKIKESLLRFKKFKQRHAADTERFEVHQAAEFPGMAALCADPGPHSLILYSPYLLGIGPAAAALDRADMPHYFATPDSGDLHRTLDAAITRATRPEVLERVL
ncbi:class 3 adenylate cyclase [Amycolatopsis lexingtonensis]|uniref:Class 3 adenylate cyclase n=1 Tax=Amycolatopsis lexingtonensis TaxID=218822 RepID=A0ABR9I4C4_9PSEU|nr:adenylate/guanylate cyclase domain-containing protein [Amycolatopsis lexingtonensis]MBE1498088.1 class 3 adenylate cyclase [Amycolatopsis lexingtonensis]